MQEEATHIFRLVFISHIKNDLLAQIFMFKKMSDTELIFSTSIVPNGSFPQEILEDFIIAKNKSQVGLGMPNLIENIKECCVIRVKKETLVALTLMVISNTDEDDRYYWIEFMWSSVKGCGTKMLDIIFKTYNENIYVYSLKQAAVFYMKCGFNVIYDDDEEAACILLARLVKPSKEKIIYNRSIESSSELKIALKIKDNEIIKHKIDIENYLTMIGKTRITDFLNTWNYKILKHLPNPFYFDLSKNDIELFAEYLIKNFSDQK